MFSIETGGHDHPVFARLWSLVSDNAAIKRARDELLDGLSGRVLEVGAGDGRSFAHYPRTVTEVVAVEPEPYLRARAVEAALHAPVRVTVTAGAAERLPLPDAAFDAAVTSLVLCSVADQAAALAELRRVLVAGGELRFLEHVAAANAAVRHSQLLLDRTGIWPRLGAGCHLARDTVGAMAAAGFRVERVRAAEVGLVARAVPFLIGRAYSPAASEPQAGMEPRADG